MFMVIFTLISQAQRASYYREYFDTDSELVPFSKSVQTINSLPLADITKTVTERALAANKSGALLLFYLGQADDGVQSTPQDGSRYSNSSSRQQTHTEDVQQGGEDVHQGGEDGHQGGEDEHQGGEDAQQGREDAKLGGEDAQKGGKDAHQGGEDEHQGGEEAQQGREDAQQDVLQDQEMDDLISCPKQQILFGANFITRIKCPVGLDYGAGNNMF
jgi:hypothetical protein